MFTTVHVHRTVRKDYFTRRIQDMSCQKNTNLIRVRKKKKLKGVRDVFK